MPWTFLSQRSCLKRLHLLVYNSIISTIIQVYARQPEWLTILSRFNDLMPPLSLIAMHSSPTVCETVGDRWWQYLTRGTVWILLGIILYMKSIMYRPSLQTSLAGHINWGQCRGQNQRFRPQSRGHHSLMRTPGLGSEHLIWTSTLSPINTIGYSCFERCSWCYLATQKSSNQLCVHIG